MLEFIDLGGRKRPLLFGIGAFAAYERNTGKKANDFIQWFLSLSQSGKGPEELGTAFLTEMDFDAVIGLTYAGLILGATAQREEIDFDAADVGVWLSLAGFESSGEIIAALVRSLQGPPDEGAKKKNLKTKTPVSTS